jgi:FkbM family methyltransferase
MWKKRLARRVLMTAYQSLPFGVAIYLAKQLLVAQGFGSAGLLESSGETGVFRFVKSGAPVLFDVGGHVGQYTKAFVERFPTGRSYVFEPSEPHLAELRKNVAGLVQVEILPYGLGSAPGRLPLYKDRQISGLASLSRRRLEHYGIAMNLVETVSIDTIDAFVAERNIARIDLLKIDVEGHELAVLRGAATALRKGLIKLVQFEFGGCNLDTRTNLQDFFYFFKEYGLTVALIQPSGHCRPIKQYDEFFEHYRTTNYLAAPPMVF